MCIGSLLRLVDAWDDAGTRVGRLESGSTVSLAFVPEARVGDVLLIHLGIPVEVADRGVRS